MVGLPYAGAWRTVNQTPYSIIPRGGPLGKIGSLDMMGADDGRTGRGMNSPRGGNTWKFFESPGRMEIDQGRALLRKGNHINPSPHEIPPKREPLAFFSEAVSVTMNGDVLPVMAMRGGG